MENKFIINLKEDVPDKRDRCKVKRFIAGKPIELPSVFSMAQYGGVAYDQGNVGSCAGQALAKAKEILSCRKYAMDRSPLIYSPLFSYAIARSYEGTQDTDSGVMLRSVMKSAHKVGMLPTEYYDTMDWKHQPTTNERDLAALGKIYGYEYIDNVDTVRHTLYQEELPVIIGARIPAMATMKGEFVVSKDNPIVGGHAMVIDCYNDVTQCFYGWNSWGRTWGANGRFQMSYQYFKDYVFSAWTFSRAYY